MNTALRATALSDLLLSSSEYLRIMIKANLIGGSVGKWRSAKFVMKQNYINHIAFVLDASGSMSHIRDRVIQVFDQQVKDLAVKSKELDQETRVSVYKFSYAHKIECMIFDKDVLRLPSISSEYTVGGNTALIDATIKSIDDLQKTAQMYGDHAFLVFVLTDGGENDSRSGPSDLARKMQLPENWTIAALVPDAHGISAAKTCGFSSGNIMSWDVSASDSIEKVGATITSATANYMVARSKGIRGSTSLFQVDTSALSSKKVNEKLDALALTSFDIIVNSHSDNDIDIRTFAEKHTGKTYVKGSCYYELIKKEEIQPQKEICIRNKISGYVYAGQQARDLLGLPNHSVDVKPEAMSKFNIFVQSTSVNRKIKAGQTVLIRK